MKERDMATITLKDGTQIYYKDWGPKSAQPIAFHHGWPLSSDDWDAQMLFFLANGYRVIAHNRRGHGRSTQADTALNFDPSMATLAALSRPSLWHSATNSRHTSRMALPLSLRKSAMVLKSGANCPVSQIISILRWHSRSRRRLDGTRLR